MFQIRRSFIRVACNVIRLAVLIWLPVHFFLTIVYIMPLTPLKIALQPVLARTIGRYVSQNWSLFAPNPVSANQALLVKCLTKPEIELGPETGVSDEGWHDLSAPLWRAFQNNRFTAYERLGRPQSNAIRNYLSGGLALAPWEEACQKEDRDACQFFQERLNLSREDATTLLRKVASSFCKGLTTDGADFEGVAIKIKEVQVRKWSKRYENNALVAKFVGVGAYPIDTRVIRSPAF
jgi:hypothetical protein